MSKTEILGKIAFINHEKKYAMIEYEDSNGKKKTVKGNIDEKLQKEQKEKKLIKKTHHFVMGDVVSFNVKLTERGDKMMASNIEFLYNNALDVLINKAAISNKFNGYLKAIDDKYFVKEMDSYLFFPVAISPWQLLPEEVELNEPVSFSLENMEKKDKIFASLTNNTYIPEFNKAIKLFKNKTPIKAEVYNVTSHGVYLNVIEDKIRAKISLDKKTAFTDQLAGLKTGDQLDVIITHMSKSKIVVEPLTTT
jgi:hypothetical protein